MTGVVSDTSKANVALRGFLMRALQTRGKVCEVMEVIGLSSGARVGSGRRGDDRVVVALLYLACTFGSRGFRPRAASVQEARCMVQ